MAARPHDSFGLELDVADLVGVARLDDDFVDDSVGVRDRLNRRSRWSHREVVERLAENGTALFQNSDDAVGEAAQSNGPPDRVQVLEYDLRGLLTEYQDGESPVGLLLGEGPASSDT